MLELTPKIIAILQKYMRDADAYVDHATTLGEIDIDLLDLPMIFLDVEDVINVQISYDDEVEGFATVGDLVACVTSRLEAKLLPPRQRPTIARTKRGWMSAPVSRQR